MSKQNSGPTKTQQRKSYFVLGFCFLVSVDSELQQQSQCLALTLCLGCSQWYSENNVVLKNEHGAHM